MSAPHRTQALAANEPSRERFASPALRYLAATRPAFLSVTLLACLIGLASARHSGVAIDPLIAALTVCFALVAHAGVNVINDYHDALSGSDAANAERVYPFTGGSRFIQNGVMSAAETARFGYLLLAAVIPPGLWLAWQSGAGLLAIGASGLIIGWAYSAPPLRLMSRGLGELAIVAGWLLVVLGSDYAQRGGFDRLPAIAGLSYAVVVATLLFINQFPDRASDEATGKRTLVVRLGVEDARWGYLLLTLVAGMWLVLQIGRYALPQACGAALLSLIISFRAARMLLEHGAHPTELGPAIKLTIAAVHVHGLLLAATLAFAAPASR